MSLPYEPVPDQEFRQTIYVDDELEIKIEGRTSNILRTIFYQTLNFLSLGICYLLLRWFPKLAVIIK